MFGLYCNDNKICGLYYKPKIDDIIKNDDNNDKWFIITEIVGRKVYARYAYSYEVEKCFK